MEPDEFRCLVQHCCKTFQPTLNYLRLELLGKFLAYLIVRPSTKIAHQACRWIHMTHLAPGPQEHARGYRPFSPVHSPRCQSAAVLLLISTRCSTNLSWAITARLIFVMSAIMRIMGQNPSSVSSLNAMSAMYFACVPFLNPIIPRCVAHLLAFGRPSTSIVKWSHSSFASDLAEVHANLGRGPAPSGIVCRSWHNKSITCRSARNCMENYVIRSFKMISSGGGGSPVEQCCIIRNFVVRTWKHGLGKRPSLQEPRRTSACSNRRSLFHAAAA